GGTSVLTGAAVRGVALHVDTFDPTKRLPRGTSASALHARLPASARVAAGPTVRPVREGIDTGAAALHEPRRARAGPGDARGPLGAGNPARSAVERVRPRVHALAVA